MTTQPGYQWLQAARTERHQRLQEHVEWFLEWQPEMKKRLSGIKLERMTGEQFAAVLDDMQLRWRRLARNKSRLADRRPWPRVHAALLSLADERRPLQERLDDIKPPDGTLPVPYLGQAVVTAFLHLRYPDKYCVWNRRAKKGMDCLGLWPEFSRGATFADRYLLINATVLKCSRDTGISLPKLDVLWWWAEEELKDSPLVREDDTAGLEGGAFEMQKRTKRSTTIVRQAKIRWSDGGLRSPSCDVCNWAMDEIYGDDGFGFIEAHHKDPLGSSNTQRLTGVGDLAPVCPNCHAILHRSGKTIEELRVVVKQYGTGR